ncbi:F-box/FBD/LRR-repeat protein At1g13570, partial [Linum perenne]
MEGSSHESMTSILSTRWRYLCASIPRLVFDASFFPTRSSFTLSEKCKPENVTRVEKVVQLYKGHTLEEFRLHLELTRENSPFVDWCLEFALSKKKVKVLELDFRRPVCSPLRMYNFRVVGEGVASTLKSLCLRHVMMSGDVLEGLLSNGCPVLEVLTLANVYRLEYVKIIGPSSRLKHLGISSCVQLQKIEIYDVVSLVSLKVVFYTGKIFTSNLPRLTELSIRCIRDDTGDFSAYHYQLERLSLNLVVADQYILHTMAPCKLFNLRELEIVYNVATLKDDFLVRLVSLFETASPYLEKIVVKVLEIAGYGGRANEDEFIAFMVANVASLETIIVNL